MFTGVKNWVLEKLSLIQSLIPAQASSSNQLADKAFVNSSIATATATFRGTYNLVSDLSLTTAATQQQIAAALATKMAALSIVPDTNDYAFVQVPAADATPTVIARVDRYKFNGSAWAYEYSLNNSGFTAAQWAAINSGITAETWATTPEFVVEDPADTDLVDEYARLLQLLYQGITDVQSATTNAKADYVGVDNYVYHWDQEQGQYVKTSIYVKGDPGTTDYTQLQNKPTALSQFIDDLGNNPTHNHNSLVNGGSYNETTKKIELKHNNTVLSEIDATLFIKDGMVDNVDVVDGNLVITFNTAAGKEPISLPITSIFDPSNYYNKTQTDTLLAAKANVADLGNDVEFVESDPGTWPF
jgi:hypothetical protein